MLIFDGDCAFCTSSAHWLEARLPADARVEPWQFLELGDYGLTEADVTTAAFWIDGDGGTHRGHRSIGRALMAATGLHWRILGRVIVTPPISWIAAGVYSFVSKNRHRMPGGTPACALPPTESRDAG